MDKLLQIAIYSSWGLWLIYSYAVLFSKKQRIGWSTWLFITGSIAVLLILLKYEMLIVLTAAGLIFLFFGMFRQSRKLRTGSPNDSFSHPPSRLRIFLGSTLVTIFLLSLFTLLGKDFKTGSDFFITAYNYQVVPEKKEILIGNSAEVADIALENNSCDDAHLRLILDENNFYLQNISRRKQVDLDGQYLNKLNLRVGDDIEINGRERLKVLKINPQFPLGRSLLMEMTSPGQEKPVRFSLHTLLNKRIFLQYQKTGSHRVVTGIDRIALPGPQSKSLAVISYRPSRFFFGFNSYYFIVVLIVILISTGVYLYLKNRFNGALLLLFLLSLPFMAGYVPVKQQIILILVFIPVIIRVLRRRRINGGEELPFWNWSASLLIFLFIVVNGFPYLLRMDGDFTLQYHDLSQSNSLRLIRDQKSFDLRDYKKKLNYNKNYRIILGHTGYLLNLNPVSLSLKPIDPEKIKIPPKYNAIINNLDQVTAGNDFLYLKYPARFTPIPARAVPLKKNLTISNRRGDSIVLSKIVNKNYRGYLYGLLFYILLPFWLFLFLYRFGPGLIRKLPGYRRGTAHGSHEDGISGTFYGDFFNNSNIIIFQWVFFMLGLGYVVFGALALYNNNIYKNFQNFKTRALPVFVFLFLFSLIISRYNRWSIFLSRLLRHKKFQVPLLVGAFLMLLVNFSPIYLWAGILFLIFVFGFRLRKDIYYEFINSHSSPIDLRGIIEKTVSSFESRANQGFFFGLGKTLNNKGWNYLLVSDVLLLMSLLFIFMQIFLGGELGVPLAGFLFLPIELGKILLTIYFADWVSRIDRGMELNVLWIYGLVLIPFVLLAAFLKDFSPLMVFSFVFFYHIIKIDKSWIFKAFLLGLLVFTLVSVVTELSRYTFPFKYFAVIFSLISLLILLRIWARKGYKPFLKTIFSLGLLILLSGLNYVAFFRVMPAPRALATRIDSWLHPWQDYNLSYQYINSLWLMKGTGTFGKSTDALTPAGHVPLIEKDLGFSLYVSVLGSLGAVLIFFTLLLIVVYVHRLIHLYGGYGRGSPFRWYLYLAEFLTVIFLAQFIVPALYTVGILPIMGQPLPFLSYSGNNLLLFALPFSFLMILIGNCLVRHGEHGGEVIAMENMGRRL